MTNRGANSLQLWRSKEFQLIFLLFLVLWVYVIVRAGSVFYCYDEIFSKWNYLVDWNPFPYHGIIDANNHFLFSLLGGFFVWLFNSEEIFVVRIASVLAFPVYFWSIYRLKTFFNHKWNFYGCLIALSSLPFLLDFFSMARGYGLSMAFLMFTLQQTMHYFKLNQKKAFYWALFGWFMTVSASLTVLPLALIGTVYLFICALKRKFYFSVIPFIIAAIPLAYLISYSFVLKDLGKLYYGGTDGFFASTVHSLTIYSWGVDSMLVDAVLLLAACFILYFSLVRLRKSRDFFDAKSVFTFFLFAAVASIIGQHWLLGVKYPTDRTALALIPFFFGAFFLMLDELRIGKWVGLTSVGFSLVLFATSLNISHSILFDYEHLDEELVNEIPENVKGTPPTTAGRWNMENELNRSLDLPFRAFQGINQPYDTLVDYAILLPDAIPGILDRYEIVHRDKISGKALLKRKQFLNRKKSFEDTMTIVGNWEFQTLLEEELEGPVLLRLGGELGEVTKEKEVLVVFFSKDTLTDQLYTYESVSFLENKQPDADGVLRFDFSYALNAIEGANSFGAYIWHKNQTEIRGELKLEVYSLED